MSKIESHSERILDGGVRRKLTAPFYPWKLARHVWSGIFIFHFHNDIYQVLHFYFHNENHPQTSAEDFGIGSTPTTELPTLPLELQAFKDNAKVQKDSKQNYLMQQITEENYKNQ